nr:MFS transporter [Sphingomonas sp. Y57]
MNQSAVQKQADRSILGPLAYAAPVVAMIFLWNPTVSVLPGLYAKYFGLSLGAIATVLLIARIVDALVDPLVGYLSDRHRARGGSRKSWVVAGGLGLAASAWFLFVPPSGVTIGYYLIWSLTFYLAWTLMDVPHIAWGGELSRHHEVRARIYSFRGMAIYVGIVAFAALPFLTETSSGQFSPAVMRQTIMVGAVAMAVALLVTVFVAPAGSVIIAVRRDSLRSVLNSVLANRPLRHFLLTYFLFSLSLGMWTGLVFLYIDSYLKLQADTALIFLLFSAAALLSVPIWGAFAVRGEKRTILVAGVALYTLCLVASLPFMRGVSPLLPMLTMSGVYIGAAAFALITPALLADIVDYGALRFGQNRSSTYFALLVLAFKASSGVGAGLALGIAAWFGFDPQAAFVGKRAGMGIQIAFIVLPTLLSASALVLALKTPITRRRHHIILARLSRRMEAETLP